MFNKIKYYLKVYPLGEIFKYVLSELYLRIWMIGILGSYSQSKEDLVVDSLLGKKKKGFFVDVGAFDPKRFSNTMRFYRRGWRGINIEPDPQSIEKFKKIRSRDLNLNIGVGSKAGKIDFYKFIPQTISTFSPKEAKENITKGFKLVNKIQIEVLPLSDVFKRNVKNIKIDFLTVDTEGYDLKVLKSNNWKEYRPKVICVEARGSSQTDKYIRSLGYTKMYSNDINSIYKDSNK